MKEGLAPCFRPSSRRTESTADFNQNEQRPENEIQKEFNPTQEIECNAN